MTLKPRRSYKPKQTRIEEIRRLAEEGADKHEIAAQTGLTVGTVQNYACEDNIPVPGSHIKKPREERANQIQQALSEGVRSLEELCRRTEYMPEGLREVCAEFDITLPDDLKPYRYRPEIDNLIDEGQTLAGIGEKVGLTKEAIRLYVVHSGQYALRQNNRERKKQEAEKLKQVHARLVFLLNRKGVQSLREKSWAYEKAIDYMTKHPRTRCTLWKLVTVFGRYESAASRGQQLSLEELAEGLDIWPSSIGRILKKSCLEPMHGTLVKSSPAPQEKSLAIHRAFELDMTANDVAYFLALPHYVVEQRFQKIGKRGRDQKAKALAWVKLGTESLSLKRPLTYRLASQIYEAHDVGFRKGEITELLDADINFVHAALLKRKSFEPRIIEKLRIIYDSVSVDKPYK